MKARLVFVAALLTAGGTAHAEPSACERVKQNIALEEPDEAKASDDEKTLATAKDLASRCDETQAAFRRYRGILDQEIDDANDLKIACFDEPQTLRDADALNAKLQASRESAFKDSRAIDGVCPMPRGP